MKAITQPQANPDAPNLILPRPVLRTIKALITTTPKGLAHV